MKVAEKLLTAIGLEPMTNKDVLLDCLAQLDGKTFEHMVLSRMSDLPEMVESIKCQECKNSHGGKCPLDDDDDACVLKLADWLDQPATETTATKIKEALA